MLKNAYLLTKIGADTAENERHFAEIWPKTDNGRTVLLIVLTVRHELTELALAEGRPVVAVVLCSVASAL